MCKVSEKKALIMMASYNGGKYIRKQIESIINQTYKDWNLIVCDDGSTDDTIDIVNDFASSDIRISLIKNDTDYHGAFENFHYLINYCKHIDEFDYYLFSDQDDIWKDNKIEVMINSMGEHVEECPILCYADLETINSNNQLLDNSLNEQWVIEKHNRVSYFFSHKVFGCNLLMNKELFQLVPEVDLTKDYVHILSHDNYYSKFAAVYGKIFFLPEVLMSYRRHEDNETKEQKYHINIVRVFQRISHMVELSRRHAVAYNQSLVTIGVMKINGMNSTTLNYVVAIENAIRKGGFYGLGFVNKNNVCWGGRIENISHKIVILLGIYKRFLNW